MVSTTPDRFSLSNFRRSQVPVYTAWVTRALPIGLESPTSAWETSALATTPLTRPNLWKQIKQLGTYENLHSIHRCQ